MSLKNKNRAKLALAELEKEMEILTKEEMNACKGGGREDVIILFDTNAVSGCGHTAVLIGDDNSGWTYYSSNGAIGGGYSGIEKFEIRDNFKTLQQFYSANNNGELEGGYIYNRSVRIETTPGEDANAREVAYHKVTDGYNLLYNSCLDVSREVVNAILRSRGQEVDKKGDGYDIPNRYLYFLEKKGY